MDRLHLWIMGLYKKKVEKRNNCQRIKSFRKARNVDKGNADLNAFDKLKYLCVSLFKNEISINSCLNDKINKRSEAIFFSSKLLFIGCFIRCDISKTKEWFSWRQCSKRKLRKITVKMWKLAGQDKHATICHVFHIYSFQSI